MKYTVALVALVASASAHAVAYNTTEPDYEPEPEHYTPPAPAYSHEVKTGYTTVCPYATKVTVGDKTYTVTESTTLVVPDYVYTVVYETPAPSGKPGHPHPAPSEEPEHPYPAPSGDHEHPYPAPSGEPGHPYSPPAGTAPGYPVPPAPTAAVPYPTGTGSNCTGTVVPPVGTATRPVPTHPAPEFTGAASKAGVALLGLAGAGLAAFL